MTDDYAGLSQQDAYDAGARCAIDRLGNTLHEGPVGLFDAWCRKHSLSWLEGNVLRDSFYEGYEEAGGQ